MNEMIEQRKNNNFKIAEFIAASEFVSTRKLNEMFGVEMDGVFDVAYPNQIKPTPQGISQYYTKACITFYPSEIGMYEHLYEICTDGGGLRIDELIAFQNSQAEKSHLTTFEQSVTEIKNYFEDEVQIYLDVLMTRAKRNNKFLFPKKEEMDSVPQKVISILEEVTLKLMTLR